MGKNCLLDWGRFEQFGFRQYSDSVARRKGVEKIGFLQDGAEAKVLFVIASARCPERAAGEAWSLT